MTAVGWFVLGFLCGAFVMDRVAAWMMRKQAREIGERWGDK